MAKHLNTVFKDEVERLHNLGLSDGKIAKELDSRVNYVHYYRYHVLKLKAHQTKRVYQDFESKLKGYIIRGIKSSAKRRGLEFNLEPEDLVIVTHCPLLNLELSYKNFLGKSYSNNVEFATVDRIDSAKGYVKGNVWIISRLANTMKSNASREQLVLFANNILKNMI